MKKPIRIERSKETGNIRYVYAEDANKKATDFLVVKNGDYDPHTKFQHVSKPITPVGEKKPATGQGAGKHTIKEVNPYGEYKGLLEEHNYYGNPLETKTIKTFQDTNPKGGFGRMDYQHFYGNNKDLVDEFKKEKGRDITTSTEDAHWFQPKFNEQLRSDMRKAGFTDEKKIEEVVNKLGFSPYTKERKPKGQNAIDELDDDFGDWTNSRARFKFKSPTDKTSPPATTEEQKKKGSFLPEIPTSDQQIKNYPKMPREWWLQDMIQMNQDKQNLYGLKKYMPWQATPDVFVPEPTFVDPTRELATNAENANIGAQGARMYSNPQAFVANYSKIQGNAAANAANILGRYNNQNVGIANQFEQQKAQIMNQYSQQRGAAATQLFDKNTIANQQFDNSKRAIKNQMTEHYKQAITNTNMTDALNQMYPQYAVSPAQGGRMYFTHGKDYVPGQQKKTYRDSAREWMRLGYTPEQARNFAHDEMGLPDENQNVNPYAFQQMYSNMGNQNAGTYPQQQYDEEV